MRTARRQGQWVAARRLVLESRHGNVSLDFSDAITSAPALELSVPARRSFWKWLLRRPPRMVPELRSGKAGRAAE